MLWMRTPNGRVPMKSPYLEARARDALTPKPHGTSTPRGIWLAQRTVHWVCLHAMRMREAGYGYEAVDADA